MIRTTVVSLPAFPDIYTVYSKQLDIPYGYEVKSFICSAGVYTYDLDSEPTFKKVKTEISYSCSPNGLIKISPLYSEGLGRKVDCLAILTRIK